MERLHAGFEHFARGAAHYTGHPLGFISAASFILAWALTGPLFGFGTAWQLVVNTGTTIVTFLMVFLIQNTQNRDAKAVHLKLDEIIRSIEAAHNSYIDLEEVPEEDLDRLRVKFERLARAAAEQKGSRSDSDGSPAGEQART